jgi:hypothetical protein
VLAPYLCEPTGRHQSAREPSLGRSPSWLQAIAGEVCQKTLILPCEAQIDYPRAFVVDRCAASRRCDHPSEIRGCGVQNWPPSGALPLVLASPGRSATTRVSRGGPGRPLRSFSARGRCYLPAAWVTARLRQHNTSAYLVWLGMFLGCDTFYFLLRVIAVKKCHVSLISQANVRPVTPEVVGSSPVAPAEDFNGLNGGRFFASNF